MKGRYEVEPYAVRIECERGIENDSDRLLSRMLDISIESRRHAVHHSGFDVSETAFVMGRDGRMYIVSGANFTPEAVDSVETEEESIRTCALGAISLRGMMRVGDIFGGVLLIRSPEDMKPIVGCRATKTLHSCGQCRPAVARIDPRTVVVGLLGDSRDITEAMTIGQQIDYHEKGGIYPTTPRGLLPSVFVLDAIQSGLTAVITQDTRELLSSTIDPGLRT